MPDEVMGSIHKAILLLLQEVDRLCKKHKIEYFLSSGTLLGAVRDQQMIPWDDDADVIIKRSEYDKFVNVCGELGEDFQFLHPSDYGDGFFDMIPRIIYKNSQLRIPAGKERFYHNLNNRVSLDFFILDNTYTDARGKFQRLMFKSLYGMAMAWRYQLDMSKYAGADRARISFLNALGKRLGMTRIRRAYDRVSRMYSKKATGYYVISDSEIPYIDNSYENELFERAVPVKLNGFDFPAPSGWDTVLTRLYGDYMVPPPEGERRSLHVNLKETKIWFACRANQTAMKPELNREGV